MLCLLSCLLERGKRMASLGDLLFGDSTLDSTQGQTSDRNVTEKTAETTQGTQLRDAETRQEQAERTAQQQNTKQDITTTTSAKTENQQTVTGSQTVTGKQVALDEQTQNVLKNLISGIAGQPAAGSEALNLLTPILSQLAGLPTDSISQNAAAQQELAKLDFQQNVLPGLSIFAQQVGSNENSAAQLLRERALSDLTTKLSAIQTDAAVQERQLKGQELAALLQAGPGVGLGQSQAASAATQQVGLLAQILKGAEVSQQETTNSLQNLLSSLTQEQTQRQISDVTSTVTGQSDTLQLSKILDKTLADQTSGKISNIEEAISELASGTQQQGRNLIDPLSRILAGLD